MEKNENKIEILLDLLRYSKYPEIAGMLKKSKTNLLVSTTYGSGLFSPLATLEIYSPPKESSFLNNLENEKKDEILKAVIQIFPKLDYEPEVTEIVYRVEKVAENKAKINWSKVIFLAHASEDKPFVRKLYKELKECGLEPWLDEINLMPGEKWDDKIIDAIRNAGFFMACLSNHSVKKNGYIQKELKTALSELEKKAPNNLYFIPALIEEVELPILISGSSKLKDYQSVRLFNVDEFSRLITHLKQQTNKL